MKKVLSVALILALALSLFAGCKGGNEALQSATAYLENMYQVGEKGAVMSIDKDKDVLASVTIDGVSYPVEWSISITEGAADSVKIGESSTENHVLIDLPDVAETDILFAAVATVKDEDGNTESTSFNYKMLCTLGDLEILDKAYALADGQKLNGTPSLTGDITEIKTPWDASAKTISVVMQVGDAADKLVLCTGLKGEGAEGLAVGDNICVSGTLGKNGGVVGFESGCTLVYVNKANGGDSVTDDTTTAVGGDNNTTTAAQGGQQGGQQQGGQQGGNSTPSVSLKVVTDQAKILKDAFALGQNETTPYIAQLTGTVLAVEKYDAEYGSVTLTFKVGDKTIECYQMKGNGADKVKSGDTITVKGVIKNYYYEGATKGKVEFAYDKASGTEVTLTKLVAAATQDLSTPAKIVAAAKKLKDGESLQKDVTLTGKVLDIDKPYDASYENISVNISVENTTILCYRLKGNGVDKIKEGDTITVTGKIKNYMGTIEFDNGCQMTKRVAGTSTAKTMKVVTSLKTGVAYKFGMKQTNVSKDAVYYLKGGMAATYYLATSSSANTAIDVYLEATNGGYYMYTNYSGKKQYINMVQSGSHVNGKYQDAPATVYTWDEELKTITAAFDGEQYYFGTGQKKNGAPSTYTTVGGYRNEEIFYCQFYEEA